MSSSIIGFNRSTGGITDIWIEKGEYTLGNTSLHRLILIFVFNLLGSPRIIEISEDDGLHV